VDAYRRREGKVIEESDFDACWKLATETMEIEACVSV
jgi:hypothetical protein